MSTVKALLPIATSIIMVVLSWGSLNTKIDLTIQKLDNIAQTVQEIKEDRKASINEMNDRTRARDDQISKINEELARLRTIINFEQR